jgi:myosin-1
VVYNVDSFLDKNKDLLFRDLLYCMGSSSNPVLKQIFPETPDLDFKRPESAGTQFRVFLFIIYYFIFQIENK